MKKKDNIDYKDNIKEIDQNIITQNNNLNTNNPIQRINYNTQV